MSSFCWERPKVERRKSSVVIKVFGTLYVTKIYADKCLKIWCTRADSDCESSSQVLLSSVNELHQPGGKHGLKNKCLLSPEVVGQGVYLEYLEAVSRKA